MSDGTPEPIAKPTLDQLAPRERDYFYLFLQGHPQKEIAGRMKVNETRVSHCRSSVIEKLKLRGDLDLVMLGYRLGLIDKDGSYLLTDVK